MRILVVDTSADSAETLVVLLWGLGVGLRVALDAASALATAASLQPDVIFLEATLQGELDGIDLGKRMREQGVRSKLVATCAREQDKVRLQTEMTGFDWIVAKPVDRDTVEKLLAACREPSTTKTSDGQGPAKQARHASDRSSLRKP